MIKKIRYSGVILHPTSLPSRYGIGDFGPQAKQFIDFLAKSKVGMWQILPLGPVGYGNSPYATRSAFAGNELLISLDMLSSLGYLTQEELSTYPNLSDHSVDFAAVQRNKWPLLRKAASQFVPSESKEYQQFQKDHAHWLDDYALYMALCDHYQDTRWFSVWDIALTRRDPVVLAYWREEKEEEIEIWKILQYFFFSQWQSLHQYATEHNVLIVGDVPVFVATDSVDAWSNREIVKMDEQGNLAALSGVPPDAFSSTGQLWGNPVYDWDYLEKDGFSWWVSRMKHLFEMTDIVRIDHFRGFESYWEVPFGETTAEHGSWVKAPGDAFFAQLRMHFDQLPVFAEDLGVITEEVEKLLKRQQFPGMKVMQFAFEGIGEGLLDAHNAYLPHNYPEHCVAYTGTHDNNTTVGWYNDLDESMRDLVRKYLSCSDQDVPWHLARAVMASAANFVILPVQDLLGIGTEGRMNTPGTCGPPNWSYRITEAELERIFPHTLIALSWPFGRTAGFREFVE